MEKKCAKCSNLAVPGKSRCHGCAERNNIAIQRRRDEKYKQQNWRCPGCDCQKPSDAFEDLKTAMSLDGQCSDCVAAGVEIKRCKGSCYQWRAVGCFPVSKHHRDGGRSIVMCAPCEEKNAANVRAFQSTGAGQSSAKKYQGGPKGNAAYKRGVKRAAQWRSEDQSAHECNRLHLAAAGILSGHQDTSPTFTAATGWSADGFCQHMKAVVESGGPPMQWDDRSSFQIEHRIPKEAYDFTNAEDIRRCWSAANVSALTQKANSAKSWKIIDSECIAVGAMYYPASWGDQIPIGDHREALYTKFRSPNLLSTD